LDLQVTTIIFIYIYIMTNRFLETFIISLIVIAVIDIPVISQVMYPMWKKMIQGIQGKDMILNKKYGLVAYILLAISISIFSIPKIRDTHLLQDSFFYGGFLGIIIYGTFDFTNLAIFQNYLLKIGIIDTLWGGLLLSLSSYIVKKILINY
jgi:uncharacterized membrane protein